jgi:hypothetical protein
MNTLPCLDAALKYADQNFSVIPIGRNKVPLIQSWRQYQTSKATPDLIRQWWQKWPDANIAIVTGAISGIVVVDVEKDGDTSYLPPTVVVKTGGGGYHFYYKHPGQEVKNLVRVKEKTDIRGDGGYVVAPPSIHHSGNTYEWLETIDKDSLAPFPVELFINQVQKIFSGTISDGVTEGTRNNTAAQFIGMLLSKITPELWELSAWPALKEWNKNNKPPLEERELRAIYESIKGRESNKVTNTTLGNQDTVPQTEPTPVSWRDFDQRSFPEERWRVTNLIPLEGFVILAAPSGEKKTWLSMAMAKNIANGEPFLETQEFKSIPANILYIDQEMPQSEIQRRGRLLATLSD